MRIESFEFHDADGWTLEPTRFDAFNLLVGVSGAGKTRIVRAIERVCAVALGTREAEVARGARFEIAFEHDGQTYRWSAEMEQPRRSMLPPRGETPLIHTESIRRGEESLLERTPERFTFNGLVMPRLDRTKSAIAILKEDPIVAPLHVAFLRCIFSALNDMPVYAFKRSDRSEDLRGRYRSVDDVGADFSLSIHHKAELFQELFPDAFAAIQEAFEDAFPLVEHLEVEQSHVVLDVEQPWYGERVAYLSAKESGIKNTIPFRAMSSGMQRYLSFLVHLSFAPKGTVVLIDELESSLGINCLPAATRFLLRRAPDLQLILTSHHPYIIEQIPTRSWKIVTRKGSHVRLLDAAAIPALEESRSRLDRFTRLINLPEYEQGIQA